MTGPFIDDAEPDWDNIVTRDRPSSVYEPSVETRGRGVTITGNTFAADLAQNRLGVIWAFSKVYCDEDPIWLQDTRARSMTITARTSALTWEGFKATVGNLVSDFVRWVKAKIDAALKYLDANIESIIQGVIEKTVDAVMSELSEFWTELVPLVGAGGRAIEGIRTMFTSAKALFDTWFTSNCAAVVPGHPEIIVESLRNSMKRSLLEGLVQTIKAGLEITAQVISAGVSTLGEKVLGVLVKAVKKIVETIMRARERANIQKFLGTAEEHWNARKSSGAIHLDHDKFVEWYRPMAMGTPVIAAITLLSHLAGDKVAYLALFQDHVANITESQFTNGANNLEAMKVWGRDYLTKSGYSFTSTDRIVSTMLGFPMVRPDDLFTGGLAAARA